MQAGVRTASHATCSKTSRLPPASARVAILRAPVMSFDTLAPYYHGLEAVLAGGVLQRCRTAFLAETTASRHALLLGEGPARFLVALLQTNPLLAVTCVERSPRMIQQARRALKQHRLADDQVTFVQAGALAWLPTPGRFDLVATHSFLDCFRRDELVSLVAKLAEGAAAEGRWLLADFGLPERGWPRWRARGLLALMYACFCRATGLSASHLTPPDEVLAAAGFRLANGRLANAGLVHSDLWMRISS